MSSENVQRFRSTLVQREKGEKSVEKKTVRRPQPGRISDVTHGTELRGASQTGFVKALLCHELAQHRETKLAHVALIMVRREALRRVLEEERQLYDQELNQRGLVIYQQRI